MTLPPRPTACCAVLLLALAAAACNGKPERDAYTTDAAATPSQGATKAPMPAYPAWATAMIGRNLKAAAKGAAVCKGALDVVSTKYIGARPGVAMEGWGWDETGARPLDKVLFVDTEGRIVGAGVVGNRRDDVPRALPEVKTPAVGWKGVAGVTSGEVLAVGVTAAGASCTLGRIFV